jgi:hypothetical protein
MHNPSSEACQYFITCTGAYTYPSFQIGNGQGETTTKTRIVIYKKKKKNNSSNRLKERKLFLLTSPV